MYIAIDIIDSEEILGSGVCAQLDEDVHPIAADIHAEFPAVGHLGEGLPMECNICLFHMDVDISSM